MNLLQEAKDIHESTSSLKEKRMNRKNFAQMSLERNDGRKWSIRESNISINEQYQNPQKKTLTNNAEKQFRITYLRTVIPFLDIRSILGLSLLNKEFNQFIISIYFYKFITEMHTYQKVKQDKREKYKQHSQSSSKRDDFVTKNQPGFLSKLTGAFSILTGTAETATKKEIDPKEFLDKLNIHERILKEKLKQFSLSKEIQSIRDNINYLVDERYKMQMNKTLNQSKKNKVAIMTDEEIEKIKKEKLERESRALSKEVSQLRKESDQLQNELQKLQKEDLDYELLLNSLSGYVKNEMNYEKIKEDLVKRDSNVNMDLDYIDS